MSVDEFIARHPVPPERRAIIERGKRNLERQVAAMKARAAERGSDDTHHSARPLLPLGAAIERLQPRIAEARERTAQERAAYTGDCFECRDTGLIGAGLATERPCYVCARGQSIVRQRLNAARRAARESWLTEAGIGARQRSWTFGSYPYPGTQVDAMQSFAAAFDGSQWLVVHGDYGTGKTGLVIAALAAVAPRLLERGQRALLVSEPDLYASLRPGVNQVDIDRYRRPTLLVIDDLGISNQSAFTDESLFMVVDKRSRDGAATWFTTNQEPERLAERIEQRVIWRIGELATWKRLDGPNLRAIGGAE